MISIHLNKGRHTRETEMLKRALESDASAANNALKYLSSANPALRRIMQETIYDLADHQIWTQLLRCLALKRWNDHPDCERRNDPTASQRIDQSVIEVFLEDMGEGDKKLKESALLNGMVDENSQLRQMAAYLLGLRGDTRAIPILSETIESDSRDQMLRAIQALESINDESCGPPLLRALIIGRGEVHREAGRALIRLGRTVESTWLDALNHTDNHIRWHGARGLGNIGNPKSANLLAEGLLDENQSVRWATADVLAQLGESAISATLTIISRHELNEQSRQAAYHALNGIVSRRVQARIKPLLGALRGPAANLEAPAIAQRLLKEWQKGERK